MIKNSQKCPKTRKLAKVELEKASSLKPVNLSDEERAATVDRASGQTRRIHQTGKINQVDLLVNLLVHPRTNFA